ncbi:IspD/TarI family cytidylyltransferase [Methanobrevibacter curvatus]|uniref:Putative ribitol-5-phosphate cytidylyltransferase n=1 Tax=Methanobrevibacter curvatus TaxID=49547 RepID=A0A166B3M5_9EURY|nr:2-C-methyl-D-erythritol 4-phosphate cytidylyltransferase [Methanobrevibacter curvatus]KZX12822.1 putative ribitol-5-phosphate cytidylyltransferase [Methanobrevibacter curvatus]
MIFAAILAGGIGNRMGNTKKPKQYLLLGEKPIIIHTIEKFFVNNKIEKIVVPCSNNWVNHTNDLIRQYIGETEKIVVIKGGNTRNESIMRAVDYLETNYSIDDNNKIITHDAVRPFISHRILEENIKYSKIHDACDTVIPATDTIVNSSNGEFIDSIPNRNKLFQGQTPQSFSLKKLKKLYNELSDDEKETLTDAANIFIKKGEKVFLINGEPLNIKITYTHDLKLANAILKEDLL